jgi:hypothetical protein
MHSSVLDWRLRLPVFLRVCFLAVCGLTVLGESAYAANAAPTISGTPATWVYVGSQYVFKPAAKDPEGRTLSFTIANKPAWASFNSTTGQLSGTPSAVGLWNGIQIRVSDGTTTVAAKAFSIRAVSRSNVAPTISGSAPTTAKPGVAYTFKPTAKDANGDPLHFTIANRPSWAKFDAWTGVLSGTPSTSNVGTFSAIAIRVSDGSKTADLPAFSIKVATTTTTNRAPALSGTPSTSATVASAYNFRPLASDADGDTLGFSIQNKPSWGTFATSTGALSGTPSATGTYSNIVISVSDGKSSKALPAFSIAVAAASSSNKAPLISGSPATAARVGATYSFKPTASDANGDALKYAIANRPSWASFNSTTGQLSGTPAAANVGSYSNIVISVSDGKTSVKLPAFSISVTQSQSRSAVLSWDAPTQNTDGSALVTLAGYRIHYGSTAGVLPHSIQVANPGVTTYIVEDIGTGTFYFAVKAYRTDGTQSAASNVVSKIIQ